MDGIQSIAKSSSLYVFHHATLIHFEFISTIIELLTTAAWVLGLSVVHEGMTKVLSYIQAGH